MKSVKKTAFIGVTVSMFASILITTASAEKLPVSVTAPPDIAVAPVIAAGAQTLQLQPEAAAPAEDSSPAPSPAPAPDTAAATEPASSEPEDTGLVSDPKSSSICGASLPDILLTAGRAIADFSAQYKGARYVYGAASPKRGFDCSGLVYFVYSQFGYSLPRTARAQYKNGAAVEKDNLLPGDLVFFATNGGRAVSHVGIYIGDGTFIHASTSRRGVMFSSLGDRYWTKAFVGARRIITPTSAMEYVFQTADIRPL